MAASAPGLRIKDIAGAMQLTILPIANGISPCPACETVRERA